MVTGDFIVGGLTVGLGILVLPALYKRLQNKGKVPVIVERVIEFLVWPIVQIKKLVEG